MSRYDHRPALVEGDVAKLPLGQDAKDGYAIVDKKFSHLDKFKWRLDSYGYAVAWDRTGKKPINLRLHRLICPTDNKNVDHIDGNKLNNRSPNLRPATNSQNQMNIEVTKTNKLGVKGVSWHKKSKKFRANICKNGKRIQIGLYDNIEEAAKAYNREARKLFGEYARLNQYGI